jgi:hypothetical protein
MGALISLMSLTLAGWLESQAAPAERSDSDPGEQP